MIEALKQQFKPDMPSEEKLNKTREFLQILALKTLADNNAFDNLAFTGGTALRILHNIRRYSEDLDFSLVGRKGYDFTAVNAGLLRSFKLNGLDVESKPKIEETVHSAFLKFSGLPHKLGLSMQKEQALFVKLEVDTNPPEGGKTESAIINKTYLFSVKHFDLPSMFATKLHACFYRRYVKGRDFYDFLWHLGSKTRPNYTLFNNAVRQTEGKSSGIDEANLKDFLLKNIKRIDLNAARKDVEKFLEDKSELNLFTSELIQQAIVSAYSG
ncbi:MAG: nucleotidyl transferase AbiEii/AbiGii toxin family protein [bacterium]